VWLEDHHLPAASAGEGVWRHGLQEGTDVLLRYAVPEADVHRRNDVPDLAAKAQEGHQLPVERRPAAPQRRAHEDADKKQLGFIIDDVAPSAAVMASGERVDMYGYQTMAVAALQVQAREIAELKRQVAELDHACAAKRR
jgi:hypothetical protein